MILGRDAILAAHACGDIVINPFNPELVSVNSVDVRLGRDLYLLDDDQLRVMAEIEARYFNPYTSEDQSTMKFERIEPQTLTGGHEGFLLEQGVYLASTLEEIGTSPTSRLIPDIYGKSTIARYGVALAPGAGRGEVGYAARWTMTLHVPYPIQLRVGTPIAQIRFSTCMGVPAETYGGPNSYQPGGVIRMIPKPLKVVE
jgi:deoxycytidine triphosphate deaminase